MKANRLSVAMMVLGMIGLSGAAMAQDQNGNRRQRGQDQQGQQDRRRGGDPAQFREQMMNRYKERLGATDEEWKVLQPKIEKVLASRGGDDRGGRDRGDRRDRGGDPQNQPRTEREQSPVSKAAAELRAAIEDKSASADDLTRKLAAYREAREKSRADRAAAQKELREVLSARQEAILVSSGLLE